MAKAVVAAVVTVIAVGVAWHEWEYKHDHPHAYGPAVVIAVLALAVALLGAVEAWSAWTQHETWERERNAARQRKLEHYLSEYEKQEGREATPEERNLFTNVLLDIYPDGPPWPKHDDSD